MMMEDASALAIGTPELGRSQLIEAVNDLVSVVADIQKIVSAAAVLVNLPARV